MHRGARDPWLDKRSAIGSVVRVTKEYRPWTPEQAFLLPPSPLDWLPEGHLAYFVLELVRELDVSATEHALQSKEARGVRPYSPRMMTALLIYAYCTGVFSSRKIERATYQDVAFRVIAAGEHPHFTTVNAFRLHIGMRSAACSPKCFGSAHALASRRWATSRSTAPKCRPMPASIRR